MDSWRAGPLRLTAAKSRFGHAEPAAGSVGVVQAVTQLALLRSNAVTGVSAGNHGANKGTSLASLPH